MGVLVPDSLGYRVPNDLNDLVVSVLDDGPWHTAIRASLEDLRSSSVPGAATTEISDALIEQTRLFTHEVRNALVPVRHHLVALSATVTSAEKPRVDASRRGVARLLDFVEQWVATAETINEPPGLCDLAEVVADALAQVEGSERIVSRVPSSPVRLRAPQQRLTFAVANLLRNAVQAADAPLPIEVEWGQDSSSSFVRVDDGGTGVAPEERGRIFDDGFSKRPAGSGFGLAFARRVVESALRGKVWCEASPLGGARFTISIPLEPLP